jgi:hypothetical protein
MIVSVHEQFMNSEPIRNFQEDHILSGCGEAAPTQNAVLHTMHIAQKTAQNPDRTPNGQSPFSYVLLDKVYTISYYTGAMRLPAKGSFVIRRRPK